MKKSISLAIVGLAMMTMTSCHSFSDRWAEGVVDGSLANYFKVEDFNINFRDSTAMIAIDLRYEVSNNAPSYEFDANDHNRNLTYSVELVGAGGRELPVVLLFDSDGREINGSEMAISDQSIKDMEYALMFGADGPVKVKCMAEGWSAAKVEEMASEAYSFAVVGNIKKTTQGALDAGQRIIAGGGYGSEETVDRVFTGNTENQQVSTPSEGVEEQAPEAKPTDEITSTGGYIKIDGANIRFRYTPNNLNDNNVYHDASGVPITAYLGQVLECIGKEGDWYMVKYEGKVLYIPVDVAHSLNL